MREIEALLAAAARLEAGEVRSWHITLRGQLRRSY
jgi:hypothetical protein